jgi:hypothetical protein
MLQPVADITEQNYLIYFRGLPKLLLILIDILTYFLHPGSMFSPVLNLRSIIGSLH